MLTFMLPRCIFQYHLWTVFVVEEVLLSGQDIIELVPDCILVCYRTSTRQLIQSKPKVPFCEGDKSLTKFVGLMYSTLFHLVTDFKTLAHPKRDCRQLQAISPAPDCRPIPHLTARDAVGEGKP